MSLERLSDESIAHMYDSIRNEIAADRRVRYPLMGETARQRAEELVAEMIRRRMNFTPIDWPSR